MTTDPIFKATFGSDWGKLPNVLKRHYANRPNTNDTVIVEGLLHVEIYGIGHLLTPVFKLLGTLPPYTGKNIPVTVSFVSNPNSNAYHFNRVFNFPDKKPYHFRSIIIPTSGQETIEHMRCGISWRSKYIWQNNKIEMLHKGYVFNLFGWQIPVPLTLLIGQGYGNETPIDDDHFAMLVEIRHWLWGKILCYHGTFKISKDC